MNVYPRRFAILSDVHANVVALRAVLAELDELGVAEIVVAGDLVGFGPNPEDVVDLLVERRARLIRGNHEKDYVAVYGTPAMPASWATDPRLRAMMWSHELLGAERRAFLAALPDALWLDDSTLVVHGSPRHVRDSVLASTHEDELERMYADSASRLAFMGHTHRPVIRETARRRLVNAGSVGFPLDGDPRASFVLAEHESDASRTWQVQIRRVAYNLDQATAAYDNGLRDIDAGFVELIVREMRTGHDYLGPWLRFSQGTPAEEYAVTLQRYLAANR
jgi:predicted phosphodiesterase